MFSLWIRRCVYNFNVGSFIVLFTSHLELLYILNIILLLQINLTEADTVILERWQAAEMKLYRELHESFQKRIREYGSDRMSKEVNRLKAIRQGLKVTCNVKEAHFDQSKPTPSHSQSVPYNPSVIGYTSGYVN